jgi:hypothetical protein
MHSFTDGIGLRFFTGGTDVFDAEPFQKPLKFSSSEFTAFSVYTTDRAWVATEPCLQELIPDMVRGFDVSSD